MLRRILSTIMLVASIAVVVMVFNPGEAEAKDVWAYTAPNQEYSVYVVSEYVRVTSDNTLKCRTKTVRGMEYDIGGWEFKKNGEVYYYRVCESQSKNGLVPVEGKWYVLDANEMISVYNACVDCL